MCILPGSSLPGGVRFSDLPGNTDREIAWDSFYEDRISDGSCQEFNDFCWMMMEDYPDEFFVVLLKILPEILQYGLTDTEFSTLWKDHLVRIFEELESAGHFLR